MDDCEMIIWLNSACRTGSRSELDPIGRSPLLPLWNLHKVELFSAFISHLDEISIWKCSWKCKSLQFERKRRIGTKDSRIRTHYRDGPVYYANHQTTEDLLDRSEVINPKKNLASF